MDFGSPPESKHLLTRISARLPVGTVVLLALTLLTAPSFATDPSSVQAEEPLTFTIPEPAPMILGLFGLCLILLRRGRL